MTFLLVFDHNHLKITTFDSCVFSYILAQQARKKHNSGTKNEVYQEKLNKKLSIFDVSWFLRSFEWEFLKVPGCIVFKKRDGVLNYSGIKMHFLGNTVCSSRNSDLF